MADAVISRNLVFPELNTDQHQAIADTVHELVSVSNPLDYHTFDWNHEEELCATYSAMLGCGFDLSLLVLDFPRADRCDLETWAPAVSAIGRAARDTGAPTAVVASLPESMPESVARQLITDGIVPLCGAIVRVAPGAGRCTSGCHDRRGLAAPSARYCSAWAIAGHQPCADKG